MVDHIYVVNCLWAGVATADKRDCLADRKVGANGKIAGAHDAGRLLLVIAQQEAGLLLNLWREGFPYFCAYLATDCLHNVHEVIGANLGEELCHVGERDDVEYCLLFVARQIGEEGDSFFWFEGAEASALFRIGERAPHVDKFMRLHAGCE